MPHSHPFTVVQHGDVLRIAGTRSSFDRQSVVTLSGFYAKDEMAEPGPDAAEYVQQRWAYQQANPYGRWNTSDHPNTYAEVAAHNGRSGSVWLSAQPVVIAAREYHASMAAEQARDIHVKVGDLVVVASSHPSEVGLYRITKPGWLDGDNCQLVPVAAEEVEPQPVVHEEHAEPQSADVDRTMPGAFG